MPEHTQLMFSHHEVVTALLKAQGIRSGIWGLSIKFGLSGMNVGPDDANLQPTALVAVMAVGLQQFEKVSSIAVDAAEVNPAVRVAKLIGAGKTKAAKKK